MIFYVVTEPESVYRAKDSWTRVKFMLEKQARDHCLVLHYAEITRALVAELKPWAICHSGGGTDHDSYDVITRPAYRWLTRQCPVPQIGFCGGHQIIARHFGGTVAHIRPLGPGDPDLNPEYSPGKFKEWGVFPVRVVKDDPLFKGLPRTLLMQERHCMEVKTLPPVFDLLASTADCRVQAFVHRRKPLYGVQFHPESGPEAYPHGPRLLRNFFAVARAHLPG